MKWRSRSLFWLVLHVIFLGLTFTWLRRRKSTKSVKGRFLRFLLPWPLFVLWLAVRRWGRAWTGLGLMLLGTLLTLLLLWPLLLLIYTGLRSGKIQPDPNEPSGIGVIGFIFTFIVVPAFVAFLISFGGFALFLSGLSASLKAPSRRLAVGAIVGGTLFLVTYSPLLIFLWPLVPLLGAPGWGSIWAGIALRRKSARIHAPSPGGREVEEGGSSP